MITTSKMRPQARRVLEKLYGTNDETDLYADDDDQLADSEAVSEALERHPSRAGRGLSTLDEERARALDEEYRLRAAAARELHGETHGWDYLPTIPAIKVVAVVGDTGSGKTAACLGVLEAYKAAGRRVAAYQFPRADILARSGIADVKSPWALGNLRDCVVWIDEPHISLPKARAGDFLTELLSLARQNSVVLLFSTSDTRWFTAKIECYVDGTIIKDLNPKFAKRNGVVHEALSTTSRFGLDGFRLEVNEHIFHCRKAPEHCGRHTAGLPLCWDEKLSTAWAGGRR